MFLIDVKSRIPIYEQLKDKTLELIALGILEANQRMPSVRTLARDLAVNPNTIQKAYQDMERDGILYTISGKGSFVSESLQRNVLMKRVKEKLTQSAQEAKGFGVTCEEAVECIHLAYKEGQ